MVNPRKTSRPLGQRSRVASKADNATGNHSSLRYRNLTAVLRLIYSCRPISRVELSRITGLNKATVSSLVAELVDNGFVTFIGEGRSDRAGRREVLIDLERGKVSAISVEIGVGTISVIAADFAGDILLRIEQDFDLALPPPRVISMAVRQARRALGQAEARNGPVAGISFAVPGAVDQVLGTVLFAPNLGWRNIPIFERLRRSFSQPVFVENEASLAALGEHFFGAACGFSEVLYISAGIGVGGGLIVGGEVYRGSSGIAGEFGHMTIDLNGKQCACGKRGCWETLVNETALFSEFKRLAPKRSRFPESPTAMIETILTSVRNDEKHGIESVRSLAKALAVGIDSITKGFDPELVVLGGPISSLQEFLIPMISNELSKRPIFDLEHSPKIVPATFGASAALTGGIALQLGRLLRQPEI
jgi:predicted NBD/HSP70 family sugar kinase